MTVVSALGLLTVLNYFPLVVGIGFLHIGDQRRGVSGRDCFLRFRELGNAQAREASQRKANASTSLQ